MIRVVSYLLIVGLLAFAAAWLADRPGDVVVTWQGRRIETSVMVLIIAVTERHSKQDIERLARSLDEVCP